MSEENDVKVLRLREGDALADDTNSQRVKELMEQLSVAILDARAKEPDLDAYYSACYQVQKLGEALHSEARLAGVTVEVLGIGGAEPYTNQELGVDGDLLNAGYDDWVNGAYLADTWVPSSLGCMSHA